MEDPYIVLIQKSNTIYRIFESHPKNRSRLYAGKLHAALDRQHPRDLFDVKLSTRMRASRMISSEPSWYMSQAQTIPSMNC
ncbi:MAG: nucleotidyl transferase AbiEii/AbiGii toxin family protein [Aestuariivita sp.]|nr:nucleotidyl transferase AbiEii/AbiGii toxin family protein [Aestuariivita sp.]MCY4202507.1 nucleotidyl transferase AbiEii/AbiGii toxin family protein [Aestuariivita sp.]